MDFNPQLMQLQML